MAVVVVAVVIIETPANTNQVFLTLSAVATGELSAGKFSGGLGPAGGAAHFLGMSQLVTGTNTQIN